MNFAASIAENMQVSIALIFGICLMFGVMGGVLASRIRWMPTITAFMLLGLIVGPHGVGLISKDMMAKSGPLIDIALGLILYKLGTMLHPKAMLRSRRLMSLAVFEGFVTYAVVLIGCLAVGLGFLMAALIAAISVSSSPAVLVHVAEELKAKGPVSDRAKSLVAINNVLAFLLFSMTMPFSMAAENHSLQMVVILPFYRLAGAVVVGIAVAWLGARIARLLRPQDEHYRFAIVIGAVMLTLGICSTLGVSDLFSPLVLGMAVRFFETRDNNLSKTPLGPGGDIFFIVLFVMAGAKIDIVNLLALGIVPLVIIAVRIFGKTLGIYMAGFFYNLDVKQSAATSMMLIPMAGMAIGLVATTRNLMPEIGAQIATLVFAMVAIFETIGPFLVTYGLKMVDEAGKDADNEEAEPTY